MNKEKYGIFCYQKSNDENVTDLNCYTSNKKMAIKLANSNLKFLGKEWHYCEIWERDNETGLFGVCGEPIYKSDKA